MKRCLLLFWLCAASLLAASDEREISIGEVSAKTIAHGIEVTISNSLEGKAIIALTHEGREVEIPGAVLKRIDEIVPESIKILTHMPNGSPIPADWLKEHEFVVSFDFGKTKLHGTQEETLEVKSRGRLHIRGDRLTYFEWMVPEGDYKNRWIYHNDIPNGDNDPTIFESIRSPK